jgi:clan AA aspartic protease
MISGDFVDDRAVVPVIFCLSDEASLSINFVIDTGFNDFLTLPAAAVAAMNMDFYSTTKIRLADGRDAVIPVHLAKIIWDGQDRMVPVLATGLKPLLGRALLQGFRLVIEFVPDGKIRIESIASPAPKAIE